MRPDCAWSMCTAGLTAQEICLPAESPFLRGSYCHSMAGSKPSWSYPHDVNNLYYSAHMDYSSRVQHVTPTSPLTYERQKQKHSPSLQSLPPKKSRPTHLSFSCAEPSTPSPVDDDQVVPSFQRLSVHEHSSPPQTPGRCSKPLPPLPVRTTDLSPEQAMDNEVEFFTSSDDSRCLVPESCSKPSSVFRYGAPSRRSFRGCGQINYAYFEGPTPQKRPPPPQQQPPPPPQQPLPPPPPPQQVVHEPLEHRPPEPLERSVAACQRQQAQRKLRRSHSGPAGSFNKPTSLRLSCHHRRADNSEVPPPIPPRSAVGRLTGADYRRWSAEVSSGAYSDEDKPPKVPPREPLSRGGSRTPSPKSLPTYVNGIMPPTQSFAPDPKYVSGRSLQRQNSEGSPCILPVMENGRKASNTHYFLLPQRPSYLDTPEVEKLLRTMNTNSPTGHGAGPSDSDWKAPVDLV